MLLLLLLLWLNKLLLTNYHQLLNVLITLTSSGGYLKKMLQLNLLLMLKRIKWHSLKLIFMIWKEITTVMLKLMVKKHLLLKSISQLISIINLPPGVNYLLVLIPQVNQVDNLNLSDLQVMEVNQLLLLSRLLQFLMLPLSVK